MSRRVIVSILTLLLCCAEASAETLTVTVTAYDEVSLSGDVPDNIAVRYEQLQDRPFKGRLLTGESAVLTLTGLPAGELSEVILQMHSNTSAGSGSLSMTVGGEEVWSITDSRFSAVGWAGSYAKDWVDIRHSFTPPLTTGDISLIIEASANSLYIASYTFVYNVQQPVPHTVSFVTHTSALLPALREDYAGEGVLLPTLVSPNADWSFIGWSATDIRPTNIRPAYHLSGQRYYPTADVTLYALYEDHAAEAQTIAPAASVQDGEYAIVSRHGMFAGAVSETGYIPTQPCTQVKSGDDSYLLQVQAVEPACRYSLLCQGDSFRIYHSASGTYIGHRQTGAKTTLLAREDTWGLLHIAAGATFINSSYAVQDEQIYAYLLCEEYTDEGEYVIDYRRAICTDTLTHYHLLYPLDGVPSRPRQTTWSSYPGIGYGTEEAPAPQPIDWTREVTVRTTDGRTAGVGQWHRMSLPHGVYIVQQGHTVRPIIR
ncbi:MAG: hypothetical protein IJ609_02620 [Paludibacteraceae bacterium]|nr:hypothetical protein [Paludibacteraceae bacterium]